MILDEIVENKRIELHRSKAKIGINDLMAKANEQIDPKDFFNSIKPDNRIRIISEIKKSSPSKGVLREDFDPVEIAKSYARNGAAAISVLTDVNYFEGSLDYLKNVREAVDAPLLRKDFIVDPYQVYEARAYGADAILLIVACLDLPLIKDLLVLTRELGMNAIVEVHNDAELDDALDADARIIGINNRDLRTFDVDINVSLELSKRVPDHKIVIAESGISSPEVIKELFDKGIGVFLIGEAFMKAPDPGHELKRMYEACA